MTKAQISIKGGESVYCINEKQLADATRLANQDPESSPKIRGTMQELEKKLTRNERAALAFMIIEDLRTSTT